jgi:hypothetical protein
MFTSPRSRFTVEDAEAVAITETRLAPDAEGEGEERHQEHAASEPEQRADEAGGAAQREQQPGRGVHRDREC